MRADLALVVIVKNEERCLQRCLRSALQHVERIVVVDTGSTDRSVDIAKEIGAEIHHFKWCDDFSAARNYALSVADADWSLVLDADEWLASDFSVNSVLLQNPFIGLLRVNNFDDSCGHSQTIISWLPRLLPRGVRYEGIIHEQPVSKFRRIRMNVDIFHDGYLGVNSVAKQGRNRKLLLEALALKPIDPYLLYQLGVDAEIYGDAKVAIEYYQQSHENLNQDTQYKLSMIVRWLHCLSISAKTTDALEIIVRYADIYSHSADFSFAAGNVYLEHAMTDPERALSVWIPRAIQAWERCLQIGEKPSIEGAVLGRGSFLAAKNLLSVHSVLGNSEKANFYRVLAEPSA